MKTSFIIILVLSLTACNAQQKDDPTKKQVTSVSSTPATTESSQPVNRSEEEWKKVLTPEQYHVLREKGTDAPFSGQYYRTTDNGSYLCAACGNELFTSDMKFDSSCGWPSFDKAIEGGKIKTQIDRSHGMVRTEILCARCGSHLGHLFDDGPTKTGLRYCVNSTSLNFVKSAK